MLCLFCYHYITDWCWAANFFFSDSYFCGTKFKRFEVDKHFVRHKDQSETAILLSLEHIGLSTNIGEVILTMSPPVNEEREESPLREENSNETSPAEFTAEFVRRMDNSWNSIMDELIEKGIASVQGVLSAAFYKVFGDHHNGEATNRNTNNISKYMVDKRTVYVALGMCATDIVVRLYTYLNNVAALTCRERDLKETIQTIKQDATLTLEMRNGRIEVAEQEMRRLDSRLENEYRQIGALNSRV